MKKFSVLISLLLLCSMIPAALVSCGTKTETQADETTAFPSEETERLWLDDLPDTSFNGAVFTVYDETGQWTVENYDGEAVKEIVSKANYDRLINVQERLDVKIKHSEMTMKFEIDGTRNYFRSLAQSGSYELDMAELRCEYLAPLALEGNFADMRCTGEFDQYININDPWWCKEFTQALNVGHYIYWLYGQTNNTTVSSVYVIFFNKEIADIVVGEDETLYDIVRNGGWTLDRFYNYCRSACYDDGNGEIDENDRLGAVIFDIDGMAIGAGVDYTKRDENDIPYFNTDFENEIAINEKLYDITYSNAAQTLSLNGFGSFKTGNTLFFQGMMRQAAELRDIKWDFGIIPLPKYLETDEQYLGSTLFEFYANAIPVSTPTDNYEMIFSILEACASEGYRLVRPAYLDEAMKNKYSRDDDTKEMIDLCTAHVTTDFLVAYGESTKMNRFFYEQIINMKNRDISSILARKTKSFTKQVENMIDTFDRISEK